MLFLKKAMGGLPLLLVLCYGRSFPLKASESPQGQSAASTLSEEAIIERDLPDPDTTDEFEHEFEDEEMIQDIEEQQDATSDSDEEVTNIPPSTPSTSTPADFGLYGHATTRFGIEILYDRTEDRLQHNMLFLQQEHRWSLSEQADAIQFHANIKAFLDFEDQESYQNPGTDNIEKWIAFAEKSSGHYQLAVGWQEITWGENLILPILDLVNPRDLTAKRGYYDPSAKIPAGMINANWIQNDFNLQLLYIPKPDLGPQPENIDDFKVETPKSYKFFSDAEWGLRIGGLLKGIDTKLYVLDYWSRMPSYRFLPFATSSDIEATNQRLHTYGASLSYASYQWLTRVDFAYHDRYPAVSVAPEHETSKLYQSIIGFSTTTDQQQTLGLEWHTDLWQSQPEAYSSGAWVESAKQQKTFHWLAANISGQLWNYLIEPSVFYLKGLNNDDRMSRFIILWNTSEQITVAAEWQQTFAKSTSPKLLLNERDSLGLKITSFF